MTDPKMVSERDAVERERAAFLAGTEYGCGCGVEDVDVEEAKRRYPGPLREVLGGQYKYRNRDGLIEMAYIGTDVWYELPDPDEFIAQADAVRAVTLQPEY